MIKYTNTFYSINNLTSFYFFSNKNLSNSFQNTDKFKTIIHKDYFLS